MLGVCSFGAIAPFGIPPRNKITIHVIAPIINAFAELIFSKTAKALTRGAGGSVIEFRAQRSEHEIRLH
jgi:hypothetical protein